MQRLLSIPLHTTITFSIDKKSFKVKIKKSTSDIRTIQAWVPQGSVLAPAFILHCENSQYENIQIYTFVDNTALIFIRKNLQISPLNFQNHIAKVENWLNTNNGVEFSISYTGTCNIAV